MSVAGDDDVTIGQRLRAVRLWRHMTLAELAGAEVIRWLRRAARMGVSH